MAITAGPCDRTPAARDGAAPCLQSEPVRHRPVHFDTVSDPAAIAALGAEWSSLFETCGRPHQVFQTVEWLAVWRSLYLDRRTSAAIVTGRVGGRLVLLWPLAIESRFGLRILCGMGEPLTQYSDALALDELDAEDEDAALDHVLSLPVDVVSLRRVRDDARIADLVRRRFGVAAARQAAPVVDLAGLDGIDAFARRLSGKRRANLQRRRRRLQDCGPLSFDHLGPSPEAVALVATALGFKRDWARRHGILAPALADPRFEGFFAAAAQAEGGVPGLRVSALRRGPEILGIELSVLCRNHLFGHVLAPSPVHAAAGVGGILAESIITNALERDFASVDLLAPADPYKLEWATGSVGVGDYVVPLSLAGRLYGRLWVRFGRGAVKRLARFAGPGLRALSRRLKPA